MLRNIVGVIVGYLAAGLSIFAVFSGVYAVLGAEGSFRPGSYEVSPLWTGIAITVGILAAALGGFVCRSISRSPKAVLSLALVMVVLGALTAALELSDANRKPEGPRAAELSNTEAMSQARQPLWMLFLNPALGFAGVLLGGRFRKIA
jgi:hypothetical protein